MKSKRAISAVSMTAVILIFTLGVRAQLAWDAELISPGKYAVYILPDKHMVISDIIFKVSLMTENNHDAEFVKKPFQLQGLSELTSRDNPYEMTFICDKKYTSVSAVDISFDWYPAGMKADSVINTYKHANLDASKKIPNRRISQTSPTKPLSEQPGERNNMSSSAACKNLNQIYTDLMTWLKNNVNNIIEAEVIYIQQADENGEGYFAGWGKTILKQSSSKEGNCILTTVPQISMIYSDRTNGIQGKETCYKSQPFSVEQCDKNMISLDMSRNVIISKSITWNSTTTYSNVTRKGNLIFGSNERSIIILNLRKKTDTGGKY